MSQLDDRANSCRGKLISGKKFEISKNSEHRLGPNVDLNDGELMIPAFVTKMANLDMF